MDSDVANGRPTGAAYRQSAETIYAGTTEIQLGIIADRVLELPRGR